MAIGHSCNTNVCVGLDVGGLPLDIITFSLFDTSLTAITGNALPLEPLDPKNFVVETDPSYPGANFSMGFSDESLPWPQPTGFLGAGDTIQVSGVSPVPLPPALVLFGTGLTSLWVLQRRQSLIGKK